LRAAAILLRVVAATADWALFGHLLGAFALVSGAIVAAVCFEAARRRRRPSEIALLLGVTRVGVALVGIGVLVAVVSGLWLVHLEEVGYGAGWVDAAIGLLVAASVLGAVGGQAPKRARLLAEQLAAAADRETDELRALLDDRTARAANWLSALLVVAIVALMVFKPG
jgi:uncharacterized membrane protein